MPRLPITFEKITSQTQHDALRAFAASFSHTIDDATLTPLWMLRRGPKIFGYVSVPIFQVIIPAFHPDHTTPRDFLEAVEQIRAWAWMNTSGSDQFPKGVCTAAFDKVPAVKRSIIERLGFKSTQCELWQSIP